MDAASFQGGDIALLGTNRLLMGAALAALAFAAALPSCVKADPCGQLSQLSFPHTTVTNAQLVAAGTFRLPGGGRHTSAEIFSAYDRLPAFCRVQAVIAPSRDSHIKVEVWLPATGWNGKLLGTGNGGYAGSLGYPRLAEAINSGYAGASTDTGHEGDSRDSRWAAGHEEKQADFDHRAIHEMTAFAKAAIRAFYGKPPAHSYFNACSNGGRQGLMEAERYPADYDGILAGAPAYHYGFRTFVSGKLDAFRDRGGKLVIYHGSADAPEGSIDYYRQLVSRMGQPTVDGFLQLYIIPGMGHCGSGDVPNDIGQWVRPGADAQHSLLSAVERWVETGVAPTSIVATQYKREGDAASGVLRTRGIFPARDSR